MATYALVAPVRAANLTAAFAFNGRLGTMRRHPLLHDNPRLVNERKRR